MQTDCRFIVFRAFEIPVSLFAEITARFPVPLTNRQVAARRAGQGRAEPGAPRVSLTGASTVASLRVIGGGIVLALTFSLPVFDTASAAPPDRIRGRLLQTVAATTSNEQIAAAIAEASARFDIPASWIRAVIAIESSGDVHAVSPKGAIGLMQVMPGTWAELRAHHHLGDDPHAVRDNILAGTAYLRQMLDAYGIDGFLAAYNAGPGRYEEYLNAGRPLPDETREYVARLMPAITATQPDGIPVVIPAATTWTAAPLFSSPSNARIVLPERGMMNDPSTNIAQQKRATEDATDVAPQRPFVVDLSGIVPQSNDLFVKRADAAETADSTNANASGQREASQ